MLFGSSGRGSGGSLEKQSLSNTLISLTNG